MLDLEDLQFALEACRFEFQPLDIKRADDLTGLDGITGDQLS